MVRPLSAASKSAAVRRPPPLPMPTPTSESSARVNEMPPARALANFNNSTSLQGDTWQKRAQDVQAVPMTGLCTAEAQLERLLLDSVAWNPRNRKLAFPAERLRTHRSRCRRGGCG